MNLTSLILLFCSFAHAVPRSDVSSLLVDATTGVMRTSSGVVSSDATTSNLAEGSNLYHTDARARSAVTSGALVGHLKSTQAVSPVATVQSAAGTGATCAVSQATDTAGVVDVTTGTVGISTGSYCQIAFNAAYGVAPICVLTPASGTISTSVYVVSATGTMDINFAVAGGITSTYLMNYYCIETQ